MWSPLSLVDNKMDLAVAASIIFSSPLSRCYNQVGSFFPSGMQCAISRQSEMWARPRQCSFRICLH